MVLPVRPWREFHPWTYFPVDVVKDVTILAMGTAWLLAGERQLQMAAHLPGVSWQVEGIEATKVVTLTKCGKR